MARILVVEDESKIREEFTRYFMAKGYQAEEARDGLEALEAVARGPFDVIVMDIKMPRMDGISAFHRIRMVCPKTPVIFITGYRVGDDGVEAFKDQAVEYLHKPFTFDELSSLVTRMAAKGAA